MARRAARKDGLTEWDVVQIVLAVLGVLAGLLAAINTFT